MESILERIAAPLESATNCYVITVVLTDVTKNAALAIAEYIQEDVGQYLQIGGVVILTSHMKDAVLCQPPLQAHG